MADSNPIGQHEGIQDKEVADMQPYPGTPRWVKLLGIVVLVAVLAFVTLHLAGGGMGPGMHMPSMQQGTQQP